MLKKGKREPDVAGRGGNRRPTWGNGEEREAGFDFRIPAISGAGASGRERGVGAGDAAHARAWSTWPGEGGDVGAAAVSVWRREREIGGRRETGPTGGPHLSATPREEAAGRPGWASACGRPSKGEGEGKGRMGRRPIRKKRRKKGGKRKRKRKKDFSLELKYCLLNFNWLKLFLEL